MVECIKDFYQGEYTLAKGETYSGPPSVEDWMLSSFPAHFVKAEAGAVVADVPLELVARFEAGESIESNEFNEAKGVQAPPMDKAIKAPRARK